MTVTSAKNWFSESLFDLILETLQTGNLFTCLVYERQNIKQGKRMLFTFEYKRNIDLRMQSQDKLSVIKFHYDVDSRRADSIMLFLKSLYQIC